MHRWTSTDNGSQCYRCGMVLDYGPRTEDDRAEYGPEWDRQSDAAHALAPFCSGPETDRAHHFMLALHPASDDAWYLDCAYGDCATDEGYGGGPATYDPECVGA